MPFDFIKLTGSYKTVSHQIHPAVPIRDLSHEEYMVCLDKDEERICYFSPVNAISEQKKRLRDTSHLRVFNFAQNDFSGGCMAKYAIMQQPYHMENIVESANELSKDTFQNDIYLSYINDDNQLCGINISYLRDDSNRKLPPKKRPFYYSISIIKDVNKSIDERVITLWANRQIITNSNNEQILQSGTTIEKSSLAQEVNKELNSKLLQQIIGGIYHTDHFSLNCFNQASARINPDKNIDNRDLKISQIKKLINMAKQLQDDPQLSTYTKTVENNIQENANFFQDGNYEKNLSAYINAIQNTISQLCNAEIKKSMQLMLHIHSKVIDYELLTAKLEVINPDRYQLEEINVYTQFYRNQLSNPTTDDLNALTIQAKESFPKYLDKIKKELIEKIRKSDRYALAQISALDKTDANIPLINAYLYRANQYQVILHSLPKDTSIISLKNSSALKLLKNMERKSIDEERQFIESNYGKPIKPQFERLYKRSLKALCFAIACTLLFSLSVACTATGIFAFALLPIIALGIAAFASTAQVIHEELKYKQLHLKEMDEYTNYQQSERKSQYDLRTSALKAKKSELQAHKILIDEHSKSLVTPKEKSSNTNDITLAEPNTDASSIIQARNFTQHSSIRMFSTTPEPRLQEVPLITTPSLKRSYTL